MPPLDPAVLDALADSYQQTISDIQIAAEFAAADAWFSFESFSGEDEESWSEILWPIVLGSAVAVSFAAKAYLDAQNAYTGIALPLPIPDLDWLEADFANWSASPMVKSRWAIATGEGEAFAAGASRVTSLVSAVTREAEQEAFRQMLDSIEWEVQWDYVEERAELPFFPQNVAELDAEVARQKTQGRKMKKGKVQFRRIPQADACGWCRVVADRLYTVKSKQRHPTGSWHNFCRCTWRKVTADERKNWTPQYAVDQEWRTVIKERFVETQGNP